MDFHTFKLPTEDNLVNQLSKQELAANVYKNILRGSSGYTLSDGVAQLGPVLTYKNWVASRRPFFRLWPGFLEAAKTVDISKCIYEDVSLQLPNDLPAISLEYPKLPAASGMQMLSILAGYLNYEHEAIACDAPYFSEYIDYGTHLQFFSCLCALDGALQIRNVAIPLSADVSMHKFTMKEILDMNLSAAFKQRAKDASSDDMPLEALEKLLRTSVETVCLVGLISRSNSELVQPCVIKRFLEKYAATKDPEYVDRSRNRGFYGWDIGKDIPDKAQVEELRKQAINSGMKSPHWRNPHFALRHVGKGRAQLQTTYIKGCFVNKDKFLEVPHGYHD